MALGTYKNVPVRPGSDAEVSQQIQEIDSGSLSAPRTFDLTPATPATGTDGALAALEATSASFTGDLAERAKQREAQFEQSSQQYLRAILDTQGQTTLQDAAYRDTVDPAETELKDINQQMLEEQHSLRRRLEVLDKNAKGVFGGALDQQRQDIKNESLARQADLAVIQLSKQGKFDSAKAIADRAVAAKVEQQRTVLDALQFNYQNNKDLFTTAEQRSFETMLSDRNRELDQEAKMEMARFEQTIRQSDPLYQAQLAKARNDLSAPSSSIANPVELIANGATSSAANSAALTSLLQNPKIEAGTRTQIANVLGVINASADLANNRIDGKFTGLGPMSGVVGFLTPSAFKREATVQNEGYIAAINLKVQQWASGASLTEQQTKQVEQFTPKTTDTDAAVRTKLNNLTNFMLTQAQSQLQSQGVTYTPAPVDLFETMKLLDDLSPEQLQILQDQGLIRPR